LAEFIGVLLRADFGFGGLFGDLASVFIGAGAEQNVVSQLAVVARLNVGIQMQHGMPQMRLVIYIGNSGADIELTHRLNCILK
jgi:hypothetical protein